MARRGVDLAESWSRCAGRYAVHLAALPVAGQEAVTVAEPHEDAECAYAHTVLAVRGR
ncbi:MAG: hypothetical protein WA892_06735 [Ornithinimicrobium sp.]